MSKKSRNSNAKAKAKVKGKKSFAAATAAKLDTRQLAAIERLLTAGRAEDALKRAQRLSKEYPDHSGLWRIQIDALQALGDAPGATLAAYRWAQQRPNNILAQQALLEACLRHEHFFLAMDMVKRLQALGVGENLMISKLMAKDLEEFLIMPDGSRATHEQMEAFDRARIHLQARDFLAALPLLEQGTTIPQRNNLAVCLFNLNRIEDAMAAFDAAWSQDPDNLFALSWIMQLRLFRGDEDSAYGLATPLAVTRARRADDALLQLHGLLLLGENQAANHAYERASGEDWFATDNPLTLALLHHLGGGAACRLHQPDQARERWKQALKLLPQLRLAQENLAEAARCSGQAPSYPIVFDVTRSLPLAWLDRLQEHRQNEATARRYLQEFKASNSYLKQLYLAADVGLRALIAAMLRLRARAGDQDAIAVLKFLIAQPVGTQQERMELLYALRDCASLSGAGPVDFWRGDGLTQIKLLEQRIHREPVDSGLPPALDQLLERSILLSHKRQFAEAEGLLRRILEQVPDHRVALGNLAIMRLHQGDGAECESLLERAIDLYPDYPVPRCNLAQRCIARGDIDRAKALVEPLMEVTDFHIQDYFQLTLVNAMLLKADGDANGAIKMVEGLHQIAADSEDENRIAAMRRALGRVRPG